MIETLLSDLESQCWRIFSKRQRVMPCLWLQWKCLFTIFIVLATRISAVVNISSNDEISTSFKRFEGSSVPFVSSRTSSPSMNVSVDDKTQVNVTLMCSSRFGVTLDETSCLAALGSVPTDTRPFAIGRRDDWQTRIQLPYRFLGGMTFGRSISLSNYADIGQRTDHAP